MSRACPAFIGLSIISGRMLCSRSAGVGRTGCFIVIDAMLERMKHEKTVDIYGHVTCMRSQRNYMVQTEDQYIFIHEALLEAATCGNTEVPARNLFAHIQKLTQVPPGESVTAMELEFKVGDSPIVLPQDRVPARTALPKHSSRGWESRDVAHYRHLFFCVFLNQVRSDLKYI